MSANVVAAFSKKIMTLSIDAIHQLKQVSDDSKQTLKYRRIAKSIGEIGIIEPIVVAKMEGDDGKYLLLDGHLRLSVLADMNVVETRCLLANDDEAYTYNRR